MSGKAVAAAAAALLVVPALLLVVVVGTDSPPCGSGVAPAPSVAPTAPPAGNASLVAAATPLGGVVAPMRSGTFQVSSPFGVRSGSVHQGQDMAAPAGTDIYAATDGVVVASGPASGFGQWIVLDGLLGGQPVSTVYGHMFPEGVLVRAGARVSAGQVIAKVGNSGVSTGPHLHFEVWAGGRLQGGRVLDPAAWLAGGGEPSGAATPTAGDCTGFGSPGGVLAAGTVPAEFEPWVRRAGTVCPGISSSLIAAQLKAENGFRSGASAPVSSTGARGPAQFMPATWATWGRDGDGNGTVDVNSVPDAVMSQAALMCADYASVATAIGSGTVSGDPVDLTLAAYNAGFGAVLAARGMPTGGDYSSQTRPYVASIRGFERAFASPGAAGRFVPTVGTPLGEQVVTAARQWVGTPYAWGGGSTAGPSGGGFDGPGLVSASVFAATTGRVSLPRTTAAQAAAGAEVPIAQVAAGDLVFAGGAAGPTQVGIALGSARMLAATPGSGVAESTLIPGMTARRVS